MGWQVTEPGSSVSLCAAPYTFQIEKTMAEQGCILASGLEMAAHGLQNGDCHARPTADASGIAIAAALSPWGPFGRDPAS